jgi:mRNA interferase MazF
MRPIVLVELDKVRPAVLLTREIVVPHLVHVSVAPITSWIRGIGSEVRVGPANGIDHAAVISCDNITTVPRDRIIRQIGSLLQDQERELAYAISHAYDLAI